MTLSISAWALQRLEISYFQLFNNVDRNGGCAIMYVLLLHFRILSHGLQNRQNDTRTRIAASLHQRPSQKRKLVLIEFVLVLLVQYQVHERAHHDTALTALLNAMKDLGVQVRHKVTNLNGTLLPVPHEALWNPLQ